MSGEFDSEYLPYGAQGINGDPAFDDDDDVEAQSFNTFYSSRLSPGLVGGHASTISSFPTSHAASELGEVAGGEGGGADLGAAIGRITFADEEDNDDVALRPLAGADIAEEEASIRSPLRRRVLRIVENIYVRIFSLVLVILDIILLFVRIGKSGWKFRDDDDEPAAYKQVEAAAGKIRPAVRIPNLLTAGHPPSNPPPDSLTSFFLFLSLFFFLSLSLLPPAMCR